MLLVALGLRLYAGDALALVEEGGDLQFAGNRAFAPHFGRMGGQHRAHQRAVEEMQQRRAVEPRRAGAAERMAQRARPGRRAAHDMGAVAPGVVLVLRDVGEVREVGERAHDGERLVVVEAVEDGGKLAPRRDFVVAMEADRGLADALDEIERLAAFLFAHGVAEQPPEQADVVAQRRVFLVGGAVGRIEGERHGRTLRWRRLWPRGAWQAQTGARVKQAPRQARLRASAAPSALVPQAPRRAWVTQAPR